MFEIIKNVCALIGAACLASCTILLAGVAIGRLKSKWQKK
jgi:hypothetical protein